ncbi:MAG: hypothetical protein J5760_07095 [Clostridia bacterium]|nr:hypothetical protein [Clostridia bacterium]
MRGSKKRARGTLFEKPLSFFAPSFVSAVCCGALYAFCAAAERFLPDAFPVWVCAWFVCFPLLEGAFTCCFERANGNKTPLWRVFGRFCGRRAYIGCFKDTLFASCAFAAFIVPSAALAYFPYRAGLSPNTRLLGNVAAVFSAAYGSAYALQLVCEKKLNRRDARFYASFIIHFALLPLTRGLWALVLVPYAALSYSYYKERQK